MLRNRVFYGLLLAVMAVIYIFTNTWYTLTLLGLCVLLPLVSLALMLFSRRGISIRMEVPKTVEKQEAVITCIFENASVFPAARLTFQMVMENQMTGAEKKKRINATVGGRKTVKTRFSMENTKVGTVSLLVSKIRVYDAFGLFTLRKPDLPEQSTVVYPDMRDAVLYMEKPIETTGDGSRYAPEKPGQDVSEIFALREYVPGDEIRKIHWKLSSKLDKTMLREFSLPLNYSVFLLMDLTMGEEDVVDAVVELYLSLSRALLEGGINHNLGWYDAAEGVFHVKELDHFEDLEMATAQVLSSYAEQKKSVALDYYAASGYRGRKSTLIYISSEPEADKIAELEVSQIMRTIYIYNEEEEQKKDELEQMIELTAISVKQAREGLPEIMV